MERKKIGAGIIAIDKQTGHILLGKRAYDSKDAGSWAPFGGTHELSKDSSIQRTAKREFSEETGFDGEYEISKSPFFIQDSEILTFYTYIGLFEEKFQAKINNEHTNSGWFPLENLPAGLLPGFTDLLTHKKSELERIIQNIKENEGRDEENTTTEY